MTYIKETTHSIILWQKCHTYIPFYCWMRVFHVQSSLYTMSLTVIDKGMSCVWMSRIQNSMVVYTYSPSVQQHDNDLKYTLLIPHVFIFVHMCESIRKYCMSCHNKLIIRPLWFQCSGHLHCGMSGYVVLGAVGHRYIMKSSWDVFSSTNPVFCLNGRQSETIYAQQYWRFLSKLPVWLMVVPWRVQQYRNYCYESSLSCFSRTTGTMSK